VVGNVGESLFFAFKPFQKLLASCRAFALNRASYLEILIPNFIKLFRAKGSSIRKGCNVFLSKVYPNKLFDVFNILFRNLYSLKQIKLAFLCNKVCFSFDIRKIFRIMADKRDFKTTIYRPDRSDYSLVRENAGVIGNGSERTERTLFFLSNL
jgi:hypothetical protein